MTMTLNPHLTRDGRASKGVMDINPRFGRLVSEAKSEWASMVPPGSKAYQKKVDQILKLHHRCAHASPERLEHIIANSINTGCEPGDSRYMPVCNECLIGGYDTTRSHQKSPSTSMIELMRDYLPGEYLMFDVNELPVYSAHGNFRYMYTVVCAVSQYRFAYYTSDLTTASYLEFCDYLRKEIQMRTGRSPKVFYKDDFSTFNGQFEVAAAYERFSIQCKNTPAEMHHLNGVAENSIRILTRTCRINLANLVGIQVCGVKIRDPTVFWPLAMENARQVYNITPNAVLHRMYGAPFAPIQRLTDAVSTAVDISSFHRFGDLFH